MYPGINLLILCVLFQIGFNTHAAEGNAYDQITLSATARLEVESDLISVSLYALQEGTEVSRLADAVNTTISNAIELIKRSGDFDIQTTNYHTSPTYRKGALSGWRVRQSIKIESKDTAKISQLLGQLQENLALESIQYRISQEKRNQLEEQLISDAIQLFRQRASKITQQMNRSDYRLVEMNIHTPNQNISPVRMRANTMAMEQ